MPKITDGARQPPVKAGASGPSCSIALSDGDGASRWRIDVDVQTPDGRVRLGSVETTPPVGSPPKARIVAMGYCPGALEWYAMATLITPRKGEAELSLAVSDCCGPHAVAGLVPVLPFAKGLDVVDLRAPAVTSSILSATAGRLLELIVTSDPAGASTFVQLFDAAAVPGDGAAGFAYPPVWLPPGNTLSFEPDEGDRPDSKGLHFRTGIVVVSSSTFPTKTEAGAQVVYVGAQIRKGA